MARDSLQSALGVLLVLGLHLFQAVLSTTIIPLCGINATNCTTALVRTENNPRVAQVEIRGCKSEMQDYCFNGECMYLVELDKHSCKCNSGYFGARCGHSNLETKLPLSNEYVTLTAVLILFFLVAMSIAIYYFYQWYQNRKGMLAASRSYKVVTTETEKDNKLFQV
ncbi:proepiregulin-like [Tiliqua scincoides]|uniref:proepiregulin-like n=1 Tax=Tiliqua scincoides TaxID=71010 RepID=UPI003462A239